MSLTIIKHIMWLLMVVLLGLTIKTEIQGRYEFSKQIGSYWELADKASTIEMKSAYIDKVVDALTAGKFEGMHNAVWLKTPNNSFAYNFAALESLQIRLREIKTMDIQSFQYQTAIQQITAQEQGEAVEMLNVFAGIWWKANHPLLWNWIYVVQILLTLAVFGGGSVVLFAFDDY